MSKIKALAEELAERAVEETQQKFIMEYRNFESQLWAKYAELVVRECCAVANDHLDSEYVAGDIAAHFGIELGDEND